MESLSWNSGYSSRRYKSFWPFFWRVFVVCFGSIIVGYGFAYFTTVECTDENTDNQKYRTQYFLLQSLPYLIATFGCYLNILILKWISRRNCLYFAGFVYVIGTVFMIVSLDPEGTTTINQFIQSPWAWVGRGIQGVSLGFFSVLCPLIIRELVPVELSVNLGVMHQLGISMGILCVRLFHYWGVYEWIFYGFPILIVVMQCVLIFFLFKYQTPQYWFEIQQQKNAKVFFNDLYQEQFAQQIFLDAKEAHSIQAQQHYQNGQLNMKSIMKKGLVIGIYIAILQQISGISYVIAYGGHPNKCNHIFINQRQEFFFQIGATAVTCSMTLSLILFNAACCPTSIKQTSQRRILFQIGTVVPAILILVTACLLFPFSAPGPDFYLMQVLLIIYMASYGLTLGPTTWLFLSQILSASQMSIAMSFNWLSRFILLFFFPLMGPLNAPNKQILFTNLAILFVLLCFCCFINYKYVVQTKNKTRLDIIRSLNAKELPLRCLN